MVPNCPIAVYEVDSFSTRWYVTDSVTGSQVLHRLDGPAVVFDNGILLYYCNGLLHRADGPSCIYDNGTISWWLDGKPYFSVTDFCEDTPLSAEEKMLLILRWSHCGTTMLP